MKGDYLWYKVEVVFKDDDKFVKEGEYVSFLRIVNIILNIYIYIVWIFVVFEV